MCRVNKKDLSEADICTKFITPAIEACGWDSKTQFRQEVYFTAGRITVRGQRAERAEGKKADYILYLQPNLPIAVIEAKDNNHSVGAGLKQALDYSEILDIPFVFSSNGDGFIEHDRTGQSKEIEKEIGLTEFPTPDELWARYKKWKKITEKDEPVITQEYHADPTSTKKPRYYQQIAINRSVEAIAKGQNRILLVMATGTGKTYVASQIIYRLWKAKAKRRILYLADRNILIDQAMNNDFKPFKKIMTKVANRKVDKSYELYMALYQGVSGTEDWKNIYKQFSKDFFDLVVVDECHRGSAAVDSAWREILEYFSSATQIGMTATPKETKKVSNIDYFGVPLYTYSLKQGIEDGFLAPYKVIRISLDKDVEGWRPYLGQKDTKGYEVPDRVYTSHDFDRDMVIDERTKVVARKVAEFLKADPYAKTIIFCVDIEHAERMRRAMVNECRDQVLENQRYVVRITGDDEFGKRELDNFIDPASRYPVIATTSKLLNTGVDVQTCKLIVLDSNIQSMTEFKQIIGRGSRLRTDYDKYYFTIMDFRQVTNLFADPDFDGEPVQIIEHKVEQEIQPLPAGQKPLRQGQSQVYLNETGEDKPRKYYVKNVSVSVLNERVQYYDKDGKLITESLKDFTRKNLKHQFRSLDDFLNKWNSDEKKSAVIRELESQGILLNELKMEVGKDFDEFDLICHVAFDQKPLTRRQRAEKARSNKYFAKYGDKARAVINALLDKYADEGIEEVENLKVLKVSPLNQLGTPIEIIDSFGGRPQFNEAMHELERALYV